MRRWPFGLVIVLGLVSVCAGQPSKPPTAPVTPRVLSGKVVALAPSKGKSDGKSEVDSVALVTDDGVSHPLIEDALSKMLFVDSRLRDRPVRLTVLLIPGAKNLRVTGVQTVKDGKAYDVDYWCEVCQISLFEPGTCSCCGEETVFRERLAK